MEEIWKDIRGFEGLYQISNLGNVKSLNYRKTKLPRNLTPKKNKYGYLWVELRKNGCHKPLLIHRLVAMAFIDNPNNYPLVNHKDENPINNCLENLEWCTNSYNIKYSLERHPNKCRGISRMGKSRTPYKYKGAIVQKTLNGEIIKVYKCAADVVKENGYNQWSITQCCNEKRKKAYGYKWEFAD